LEDLEELSPFLLTYISKSKISFNILPSNYNLLKGPLKILKQNKRNLKSPPI